MLILPSKPELKISVGIADSHKLLVEALSNLLEANKKFQVTLKAFDASEVLEQLATQEPPEILLIGINKRGMDGPEMVKNIKASYPDIKTIAFCMEEDQRTLIRMIREGCRGWLPKDMHPEILQHALVEVHETGYYNADGSNVDLRRLIWKALGQNDTLVLTEEEKKYLSLACYDLSFKEIVDKMKVHEKTLNGYWNSLCDKLNAESRVGLVLEGFRRGLINDYSIMWDS